jgi:hypothetical protein
MTLVHNWTDVLRRAWSVRLMILAAVLSGAEVALPLIDGLAIVPGGVPPGLFAVASAITTAVAFVARLVAQKNLPEG